MIASGPRPRRSTTPGRKFWTNTSAPDDNRRTTAAPASVDRSTAIDRLPRFRLAKYALMPPRPVPTVRMRSPATGSTLITSAPWSARTMVANGPDMLLVRSMTRVPASGVNPVFVTRQP